MKIGYRTIKTAIGTPIAVLIAQLLGVTNFISAGILTILSIQPSRKRSVLSAWHRFFACIIASVLSYLFFEFIGYNTLVLGLMLVLFIPITVFFKITPGIATSSVITLNLYSTGNITFSFLMEQYLLIIVGLGVGLLVNLYMPSYDNKLKEKQKKLEHCFRVILLEIALYIRENDSKWDGKEIAQSEEILDEASDLVKLDRENHMLRSKHPYYDYFIMRSKQLELLRKMLPLVTRLPKTDQISLRIANFFEKLADVVHPGNTAIIYLEELHQLKHDFNQFELPKTREEFETRANMFRLLLEIESYLLIKSKYKQSDVLKKQIKKTGTT
ncbi:aromatic acid exporter family protein [Ornithinibacillus sp. L9]|uniref:Aromatic acid exporter family protein n=1 Tax=Ornithinibacillus caprae TaxID=2678566 RepID=A0A6N8FDD6_9BACI|nr:aromatic acid exporter family protein [Ornithinibacillus caprae]